MKIVIDRNTGEILSVSELTQAQKGYPVGRDRSQGRTGAVPGVCPAVGG